MTIFGYFLFCFRVNKNLWLRRRGRTHAFKKIFSANTDFEAISLFRVNSYRTSAKVQTISQQSSFISCSNFSEMEDSPRVTAWLNEGSDVAHCNRKTITTQVDVSVKKSQNYCLRAKPWMGTSFLNFLYVILTYLGGLEKRTKEKNRADRITSR